MISVITPAYNCFRFLREAVESAVSQQLPPSQELELLLVEDCSTDDTLDLARELEREYSCVRLLCNFINRGVVASRNRGIEEARGEYLAFLDADDVWRPDKLSRQLAFLKETGLDLCCTAYSFINEESAAIGGVYTVPERVDRKRLLGENVIGLSSVLLRREALGEHRMRGGYAHEDYVLWLELMAGGCKMGGVNTPLTLYRISDQNRSGDKRKAAANRWDIYRRFLGLSRLESAWWFLGYAARGALKHKKLR